MKKLSIILIVLVLMAFNTAPEKDKDINNTSETQKTITEYKHIIIQKQEKAGLLELNAQKTNDIEILERAKLLRKQCFKYEAAIACLNRHLN